MSNLFYRFDWMNRSKVLPKGLLSHTKFLKSNYLESPKMNYQSLSWIVFTHNTSDTKFVFPSTYHPVLQLSKNNWMAYISIQFWDHLSSVAIQKELCPTDCPTSNTMQKSWPPVILTTARVPIAPFSSSIICQNGPQNAEKCFTYITSFL